MTSFVRSAQPTLGVMAFIRNATRSWADARRRAREEDRHYNRALREARMIADLSRAMNGLAVENVRRYD